MKGNNQLQETDLRDAFDRITRSTRQYAISTFGNLKFNITNDIEKEKNYLKTHVRRLDEISILAILNR